MLLKTQSLKAEIRQLQDISNRKILLGVKQVVAGAAEPWVWWNQEHKHCPAGWTLATLVPKLCSDSSERKYSVGVANWATLLSILPHPPAPTTTVPGMSAGWPWWLLFGLGSVRGDFRRILKWIKWNGGMDFITQEIGLWSQSPLPALISSEEYSFVVNASQWHCKAIPQGSWAEAKWTQQHCYTAHTQELSLKAGHT